MTSKELESIKSFMEELETYQSNHYGRYDRGWLIIAWRALSQNIKDYLGGIHNKNKLFRGCDGISEDRAISFTDNKSYANSFGAYTIPFTELESYTAVISTAKAYKLNNKLKLKCEISDDEGEVIVIYPKWKSTLNIKNYRN